MQPGGQQPVASQRTAQPSRWARFRGRLWMWAIFVPSVLSALGLGFHIQLSGAVGEFASLAVCAYFGALLAPPLWSLLRANPGVLHMRVIRRVLVGFAITIFGIIGLAITDGVLDQSAGLAFLVFVVMAFGGIGFILVAMFIGLLDASKSEIERYQAQHIRESDA